MDCSDLMVSVCMYTAGSNSTRRPRSYKKKPEDLVSTEYLVGDRDPVSGRHETKAEPELERAAEV